MRPLAATCPAARPRQAVKRLQPARGRRAGHRPRRVPGRPPCPPRPCSGQTPADDLRQARQPPHPEGHQADPPGRLGLARPIPGRPRPRPAWQAAPGPLAQRLAAGRQDRRLPRALRRGRASGAPSPPPGPWPAGDALPALPREPAGPNACPRAAPARSAGAPPPPPAWAPRAPPLPPSAPACPPAADGGAWSRRAAPAPPAPRRRPRRLAAAGPPTLGPGRSRLPSGETLAAHARPAGQGRRLAPPAGVRVRCAVMAIALCGWHPAYSYHAARKGGVQPLAPQGSLRERAHDLTTIFGTAPNLSEP